ncbi:uncharacterized protein Dvir_GJ27094 [Drosophila virilis]|uniref:Uncharacterized protein n=1 Tax=Drosophila virilis TaxID=7244 RepID=A0A0Q9W1Q1_DROVI|nr:uncharacterized protein LOC26531864 [Drosophila virilis]KRF78758.1 uncharacterized protein Dvir_GJ27094 [Drosophila virilis]
MSSAKSVQFILAIYLMLIDQPASQAYRMGRLEFVMEHMARNLESPRHNIRVKESKQILKEFSNFGAAVSKASNDNRREIHVANGQTYSMYFDFTRKNENKKYNFQFNN